MEEENKAPPCLNQTIVIVLGMHRTGSSLVSSILHHAGINMGDTCQWKSYDNPAGFYEDKEFLSFNIRLLQKLNSNWYTIPRMNDVINLMYDNKIINKVDTLIKKRQHKIKWGFKDPRTVLTLPIYMHYLCNKHKNKTKLIFVYRNPVAVAKSLMIRNNFNLDFGLMLCNAYVKNMTMYMHDYEIDKLHVSYEELINKPESIKQITDFVDTKLTDKIKALVNPEYRHNF